MSEGKSASFTFGRFSPPTTGHKKLIDHVVNHAKKQHGDHFIFASHTHDVKKNPLTHSQKIGFMKKMFPHANIHNGEGIRTPLDALKHLHKKGYTHVHMFVGDDRKHEMNNLAHHYHGPDKEYHFKHLEVHSAGARDPDSEGVEGMSASKMRHAAASKNFKHFASGVPSKAHAKELYHAVRKGMKMENFQPTDKALFIVGAPGSGKDFVIKGILAENDIIELALDKLFKAIMDKSNIPELNEHHTVIVNGNADNLNSVLVSKAVLEAMGYDTAMCYVYTSSDESKARNDLRLARGVKTISESVRAQKYQIAVENYGKFAGRFLPDFFEYDNSANFDAVNEEKQNDICSELVQLGKNMAKFFEGKQKPFPKRNDAPRVPAVGKPAEPILKGYERVRKGSFWVLQPKGGIQREEANLDKMFENYSSTAVDSSKGNINAGATNSPTENPMTVMAKNKNTPRVKVKTKSKTKSAVPPAAGYFDARSGAVPSGGVGLTSSYIPKHGKTLTEIRGKSK